MMAQRLWIQAASNHPTALRPLPLRLPMPRKTISRSSRRSALAETEWIRLTIPTPHEPHRRGSKLMISSC
ncbi:unnamed protein product, partial [Mesorhabditis belari]|uniref:Uncharacterized protein n=1 Tax=Mesorhabditis belari TaxID=2138241 RepID=A0AAF3FGJ8_9BILA